jgi:hypothetical protein
MKIFIVTSSETDYDDNYYNLNPYSTAGNIDFVHIGLDPTVEFAKSSIAALYEEFEDNLDDIEWCQYTHRNTSELSDQDKLDILKEITHATVKIHVYKCELNDKDEAIFKLDKRLVINKDTQEPETDKERKWW